MRLIDFRKQHLKDTGDENLNEVYRQLTSIGMGNLTREATRADLHLYKTQFDNNLLAFSEGLRYASISFGASKTEVDEAITKIREGLK